MKKYEVAKKIIKWIPQYGRTKEEHAGWLVVNRKTGVPKRTVYKKKSTALRVVNKLNK